MLQVVILNFFLIFAFSRFEVETLEISPYFNARRDVRFLVFTHSNPLDGQQVEIGNVESLMASSYNASLETRLIIHGWQSDGRSPFPVRTTAAYLHSKNLNVFVVDWGLGARVEEYSVARFRVIAISQLIAEFLDFLHDYGSMNYNELVVVGYSLGAHAAGIAGKTITNGKIGAIVSLDPARPLFFLRDPTTRLDSSDANFVMTIHTNAFDRGFGHSISHVDFYPNGGSIQPGCGGNPQCSHARSFALFEESLIDGPFKARRCNDISEIIGECNLEEGLMGGHLEDRTLRGIFHLRTNDRHPFAIR